MIWKNKKQKEKELKPKKNLSLKKELVKKTSKAFNTGVAETTKESSATRAEIGAVANAKTKTVKTAITATKKHVVSVVVKF